jgi:hypothetical protein
MAWQDSFACVDHMGGQRFECFLILDQIPSQTGLSFRHGPVLRPAALLCRIVALGAVVAIVIQSILPHFNVCVTGRRPMQNMIKPVPTAAPESGQQLSLLLWEFLTRVAERLFGTIRVAFVREISAGLANHLRHFWALGCDYNRHF